MRVGGSLSLSLFLFSLPSVSTSRAAAFSSVCRYFSSGMYSNEGSVIRTTFWCTSQSAPHFRASASKCKACILLYYCTLYLLLYFFSTTFIQRLEILCRLRLLRVDWLLLLICDQSDGVVGGTQWEDVASHREIDSKKKQKNTKADNRKHFDIDQCVHRSVPNNQDDSWSMLPESEVYKHIIRLLHLYNLKQTSASALKLY